MSEQTRKKIENQLHIARLRLALARGERARAAAMAEIERIKQTLAHLDFAARQS